MIAATVGAATGILAAAASLWNSCQFSVLGGRVDELSAHSTAAYARPRQSWTVTSPRAAPTAASRRGISAPQMPGRSTR